MSLYSIISGVLFFLSAFGVFESFLRVNKINRFFVSIFFLFTFVISFLPDIYIWKFYVSPNLFLYLAAALFLLLRKNTLKGIIGGVVVFLTTITILVVYFATNLNLQFTYVEPIAYLALVVGCVFVFSCDSFNNMFLGLLLGSIIFQLAKLSFGSFIFDDFVLFDNSILTFVLICSITYVFVKGILCALSSIKVKRQQKNMVN